MTTIRNSIEDITLLVNMPSFSDSPNPKLIAEHFESFFFLSNSSQVVR